MKTPNEYIPEIVTLMGDFLQLLGDTIAFILEVLSEILNKSSLADYIPLAIMTTVSGNAMQALGAMLAGICDGELQITHILPIIGNVLQVIGGVIESTESTT